MAWSTEKIQTFISGNVGASVGALYFALTIGLPFVTPSFSANRAFNIGVLMLIGIASGMLGWGIGIFLSPIGPQVKSATVLASAFTSFWTGVVVSHIEAISRTLMSLPHNGLDQAFKVRALFSVGIFLMTLLVTVNSRFPESTASTSPSKSSDQTE